MSTLVVKNLPEALHEKLREQALQNHRSITKQAIVILEQGLMAPAVAPPSAPKSATAPTPRKPFVLPPPIELKGGPVTTEWILAAIAEGRE